MEVSQMGVPRFVAGAAITEPYDSALRQFQWGDRFLGKFHREYILIQFNNGAGNEAAVAGRFLAQLDMAASYEWYEGTADLDDGDVLINMPLGQMQSAPADGEGVWCQYKGPNRLAALTAGVIAQNSEVMLGEATIGGLVVLAGAVRTVGIAAAAAAGNALAAGALYLDMRV
jgi:hypothetical protein